MPAEGRENPLLKKGNSDAFFREKYLTKNILEGKTYPCAELILTPPATLDPVLINEGMVSNMLNEYKSHLPTDTSENRKIS